MHGALFSFRDRRHNNKSDEAYYPKDPADNK
jgi:hypothetical protein